MGFFSKKDGSSKPEQAVSVSAETASNTTTSNTDTSTLETHRPIFLLVWKSATFKSHWAIFVPNIEDRAAKKGKYFHVEGSPLKGFVFQIVRGWDINLTRSRPFNPIELGWCQVDLITDTPTASNQLVKDSIPRDRFEEILASIPAPGKSMRSASTSVASSSRQKAELSDCQWWTTQCIDALVDQGYLISCPKGLNKGKDPRVVLSESPRN